MNRLVLVAVSAVLPACLPASVRAQTTHLVNLDGITFIPADLTIAVGDTVHWVWLSGLHDVESGETGAPEGDGRFSSGAPVSPPMTFDFVFDQAFLDANPVAGNVYPYYCSVHFGLGMTATVTVQSAGGCIDDLDCDDVDACNGVETCRAGGCVDGTPPNCDDGNPCTDDSCDTTVGCRNVANDANSCSDGNACTVDGCVNGTCSSTF